MFVPSSIYFDSLKELLGQSGPLSLAVAFWGESAVDIIPTDRSIRLLCNLQSGGTNPSAIETFLNDWPGVEVRHDSRLHAKVALTPKAALIGSANISANGLNLEDTELSGWEEAGWRTDDKAQVERIHSWFDHLWSNAKNVTQKDIKDAKRAWKLRRSRRPLRNASIAINLLSLEEAELQDRDISLVMYREEVDQSERERINKIRAKLDLPPVNSKMPLFTGWPRVAPGKVIVSLHYRHNGQLTWDGLFEVVEPMATSTKERDDWNWVCRARSDLFGPKVDSKATVRGLKPHIANIWAKASPKDDMGRMLDLIKALEISRTK